MSDWKRPSDLEEKAQQAFEKIDEEEGGWDCQEDAFVSGVLWCALVAEGRLDISDVEDEDED